MTITNEHSVVTFSADGITVAYPFTIPYQNKDNIQVRINGAMVSQSDYDVSPNNSEHGGTVTFNAAPIAGAEVTVFRMAPLTQEYDYPPYGPFPAESHERALDKLTMLIQQVNDEIVTQMIPAFTFVGEWQPHTEYFELNIASYDGSYYIAIDGHVSDVVFTPHKWNLILPASVDDAIAAALEAANSAVAAADSAAAAAISALEAAAIVDPNRTIVGIAPVHVDYNAVDDQLEVRWESAGADIVPVGTIIMWLMENAPNGYLECNGDTKLISAYPDLFAAISNTFGGDGVTDFKLPDFRGMFLRGWDHGRDLDPDRLIRADRGDGQTGDKVGTTQESMFKFHNHVVAPVGDHLHPLTVRHAEGHVGINADGGSGVTTQKNTLMAGGHAHSITGNGGHETRPVNINVMYCIKTL